MPDKSVFAEYFSQYGMDDFLEKSNVLHMLANQEKDPAGIDMAFLLSLYDYDDKLEGMPEELRRILYIQAKMASEKIIEKLKEKYCHDKDEL